MSRKQRQAKKNADLNSSAAALAVPKNPDDESPLTSAQWTTLRKQIRTHRDGLRPESVFGAAAKKGSVYRWGLATALGEPCNENLRWLTRLASGDDAKGKRFRQCDPSAAIDRFQGLLGHRQGDVIVASEAVIWSAAMPNLLDHLDEHRWWNLLGAIQDFRDGLLHRDPADPAILIGVAEIGLTLSCCLHVLPSCRRLIESSRKALKTWCECEHEVVSAVVSRPEQIRLVLASLLRVRKWIAIAESQSKVRAKDEKKLKRQSEKRKSFSAIKKGLDAIGVELATWEAAMTRQGGVHSLSDLPAGDLRDDVGPRGLLCHAADLDRESLGPAIRAALGESKTGGRLAWQVSLPESMLHDEDAKLACLLPEWDVRRGRMVVDYRRDEMQLEIVAGRHALVSGRCETDLQIDGQPCSPIGEWEATCEYTDDDVHYLELEQPHQNGYAIQRQLMVIREDRSCFFADAVIHDRMQVPSEKRPWRSDASEGPSPSIDYQIRMPLAPHVDAERDALTSESFLVAGRRRALVIPLAASEWRDTTSATVKAKMEFTEDRHLLLTTRGAGQLYSPLWFDLSRWRFSSKRTWRQLTVGEDLRSVPPQLASAYRIQVGASQWIIYRSMTSPALRTFFGKHMIADFYCARFDASEQSYEDLITVEDNPE